LKGKSFVLGYQQLAIIFEKQGKYDEAIDICNLALDNDVKGDWKKRIEKYSKKRDKSSK